MTREWWTLLLDEGPNHPPSVRVCFSLEETVEMVCGMEPDQVLFSTATEDSCYDDSERVALAWLEMRGLDGYPPPPVLARHIESRLHIIRESNESGPYSADDYEDYRRDNELGW